MAEVALGCIGKYLKGSGAESILVESSIFGVNVVNCSDRQELYIRTTDCSGPSLSARRRMRQYTRTN